MRKIKFKAFDKNKNCIADVDSIEFVDAMEGRTGCNVFVEGKRSSYWLDNGQYELMEYTGLQDKNDKEIYEGYILFKTSTSTTGKVIFVDGEFIIKWKPQAGYVMIDTQIKHSHDCEIIGNIYQNPELMERTK